SDMTLLGSGTFARNRRWSESSEARIFKKGLLETAVSSSASERKTTGILYPRDSSIRVATKPGTRVDSLTDDSKITLPLWMNVRTFLQPASTNIALKSCIRILFLPPTLIPRRSARYGSGIVDGLSLVSTQDDNGPEKSAYSLIVSTIRAD